MRRKTRKQLGGNKEGRRPSEEGADGRARAAGAEEEEGPRVARGRRKEASLPPSLLPSCRVRTHMICQNAGGEASSKEGKVGKVVHILLKIPKICGKWRMRTS